MIRRACYALVLAAVLTLSAAHAEAVTLRVGGTQAPPGLGNPFTAIGPPSGLVWGQIFDALTVLDEKGQLQPALAESWTNTAPTTWVFKLRPGVTFHNGKPCDAAAVAATINYLLSEDAKRFLVSSEVRMVTGVRVIDPLTIEFTTRTPDAILPTRLNLVMIVEPEAWKSLKADGFALAPVGTGPFKFIQWGRGKSSALLDAYPASWRGKPNVDKVEILAIGETSARIQAVMANQVDLAIGFGPEDGAAFEQAGFSVHREPYASVMSIAFRTLRSDKAPLKDQRVRYALNLAVDRVAILKQILNGIGGVASQGATPLTFGYNPAILPYSYDPARAKMLLAEAGYPNGFPLVVQVMTGLTMSDGTIYQKVAQDLGKIGVKLELRATTFANWMRNYASGEWGDIDAFSITWSSAPFQDVIRPIEYFSCAKINPFACDESLMPLITASTQDMNPASRQKKLGEILAKQHDTAPALFLIETENISVASPKVGNLHARMMGLDLEKVTLKP